MTKRERRKARKAARSAGEPLTGELAIDDRGPDPIEFTETARGRDALNNWARRYDDFNGAPESEADR